MNNNSINARRRKRRSIIRKAYGVGEWCSSGVEDIASVASLGMLEAGIKERHSLDARFRNLCRAIVLLGEEGRSTSISTSPTTCDAREGRRGVSHTKTGAPKMSRRPSSPDQRKTSTGASTSSTPSYRETQSDRRHHSDRSPFREALDEAKEQLANSARGRRCRTRRSAATKGDRFAEKAHVYSRRDQLDRTEMLPAWQAHFTVQDKSGRVSVSYEEVDEGLTGQSIPGDTRASSPKSDVSIGEDCRGERASGKPREVEDRPTFSMEMSSHGGKNGQAQRKTKDNQPLPTTTWGTSPCSYAAERPHETLTCASRSKGGSNCVERNSNDGHTARGHMATPSRARAVSFEAKRVEGLDLRLKVSRGEVVGNSSGGRNSPESAAGHVHSQRGPTDLTGPSSPTHLTAPSSPTHLTGLSSPDRRKKRRSARYPKYDVANDLDRRDQGRASTDTLTHTAANDLDGTCVAQGARPSPERSGHTEAEARRHTSSSPGTPKDRGSQTSSRRAGGTSITSSTTSLGAESGVCEDRKFSPKARSASENRRQPRRRDVSQSQQEQVEKWNHDIVEERAYREVQVRQKKRMGRDEKPGRAGYRHRRGSTYTAEGPTKKIRDDKVCEHCGRGRDDWGELDNDRCGVQDTEKEQEDDRRWRQRGRALWSTHAEPAARAASPSSKTRYARESEGSHDQKPRPYHGLYARSLQVNGLDPSNFLTSPCCCRPVPRCVAGVANVNGACTQVDDSILRRNGRAGCHLTAEHARSPVDGLPDRLEAGRVLGSLNRRAELLGTGPPTPLRTKVAWMEEPGDVEYRLVESSEGLLSSFCSSPTSSPSAALRAGRATRRTTKYASGAGRAHQPPATASATTLMAAADAWSTPSTADTRKWRGGCLRPTGGGRHGGGTRRRAGDDRWLPGSCCADSHPPGFIPSVGGAARYVGCYAVHAGQRR